ncbi:ABC transporter permease [Glutamicibacter soli]|uniref:Transport permease protein n=1 Tax=Glutamicibacter soli TaxID=453836 RepID=A0A6L9G2W7_9MICC|nr:ABC transporter permease [Glutamicibacter soli]NAZ15303.1 ABC transporter permease [Glutamicibacter soli]
MSIAALHDSRILTGRSLRQILRSPDTIITTAITPIAMMLLFVFVFGGAINTGSSESYVNYMLPGILAITIASGVAYTSYRLFLDMSEGMMLRLRSLPISRSSMLWGHVLTSLAANAVSLLLVIGVAFLAGFRPRTSVLDWLAAAALLLTTLALTWIAVIAGLSAKTVDGASAFSYPLILLPFVSSAFVPTDSMPSAVAWFAENQPITAIVDSLRSLLTGGALDASIGVSVAWLLGLLAAAWVISLFVFRSKARG